MQNNYLILKFSDMRPEEIEDLEDFLERREIPTRMGLVVEPGWPMYDEVSQSIQQQNTID